MSDLSPLIEFRKSDFVPTDDDRNFVLNLIRPAMVKLKLGHSDVRKLIIADNNHYGDAIQELLPNGDYTNNNTYQGIGKALPQIEGGIYKGSNLVINAEVIDAFAASDESSIAGEREVKLYAFYHELGHAVDYRDRQLQHKDKTKVCSTSYVKRCANSNSAAVLSEYAACFFSASFMTSRAFLFLADSTRQGVEVYLEQLAAKSVGYRSGLLDFEHIQNAVIGRFWFGIQEYAKLFAYLHGHPALAQVQDVPLAWPSDSKAAKAAIELMSISLRDAWSSYPNCSEAFESTLTDTWFAVSKAEGYHSEVQG